MKTLDKVIVLALLTFIACSVAGKVFEVWAVKEIIRHNMKLEELQNDRDTNELKLLEKRQYWIETLQEVEG